VGSLMGAFEGKLDQSITVDDFDFYTKKADFASPRDRALFWISNEHVAAAPSGFVRPEDSVGGSLMDGLVFCGNDKREACPEMTGTGAQASFWNATYQAFAKAATGRVVVAVGDNDVSTAQLKLVLESALPNLSPSSVTEVQVVMGKYSTCSENDTLFSSIKGASKAISKVSCTEDKYLLSLWLCGNPNSESCNYFSSIQGKYTADGRSSTSLNNFPNKLSAPHDGNLESGTEGPANEQGSNQTDGGNDQSADNSAHVSNTTNANKEESHHHVFAMLLAVVTIAGIAAVIAYRKKNYLARDQYETIPV